MKILNKVHILNENRRIDENGYLFVPNCPLIHEGIMEYLGSELIQKDKATGQLITNIDGVELIKDKVYKLNISKSELKKSLDTFKLIPIVNDHVFLGNEGENAKGKQEGAVGQDLRIEELMDDDGIKKSFIIGTVNFTNIETIKKIQKGSKEELSTAYNNNLVKSNNKDYDFEVIDIKGNHIALVEKGRAGSKVRVVNSIINNKCNSNMDKNKYTLNGKDISEEELKKALLKKEEKKAENEEKEDKKKEVKEENKSKNEEDKVVKAKKEEEKAENNEKKDKEEEITNKKKTKNSVSVELMNSLVNKAKEEVKKDFANRIKAYNSVKGKVGEFDYSEMEEKEIYSHALKNCDVSLSGNESLEALKLSFKVLNEKTRIENVDVIDSSKSVVPNHIN